MPNIILRKLAIAGLCEIMQLLLQPFVKIVYEIFLVGISADTKYIEFSVMIM